MIAHWRKGARDELRSAQLLFEGGQYANALFHCHLAVEKALKTLFMEKEKKEAPFSHNLLDLARLLDRTWTPEQEKALDELTDFVSAARYNDPVWAEHYADEQHASQWIAWGEDFLSSLL